MSRVSSIRSAAQATFSAPRQVPIRWRLAGGSALLTLVILCGFAGAVGGLTTQRLHEDFDARGRAAPPISRRRASSTRASSRSGIGDFALDGLTPPLSNCDDGGNDRAHRHRATACSCDSTARTQDFGPPKTPDGELVETAERDGYLVETRELPHDRGGPPSSRRSTCSTPARWRRSTRRSAACGCSCSSASSAAPALALLAGLMVARRAMAPIAELTATARKIERTRDPAETIPSRRGRRRGRRARPHAGRHARTRSTPRAARPRTPCAASASSSPTPRTSCARR